MAEEITFTEEQQKVIDSKVNEAVEKATKDLVAKHNSEMANLRVSHKAELDKLQENAKLSAEELAKKQASEELDSLKKTNEELMSYKKDRELVDLLTKEGLPTWFKNDTRLLSAEEGKIGEVIKTIKGEYEGSLPKGANQSTIVDTGSGVNTKPNNNKVEIKEVKPWMRNLH